MKIREANKQDTEQLIPLMLQVAGIHVQARKDIFKPKNKEEIFADLNKKFENGEKIIVVEENQKILGTLIYRIKETKEHINLRDSRVIWIEELVIDERNRTKGLGRALIDEAIKIAKDENCARVDLNCWDFNKGAIAFYEKIGMQTQRRIMELKI